MLVALGFSTSLQFPPTDHSLPKLPNRVLSDATKQIKPKRKEEHGERTEQLHRCWRFQRRSRHRPSPWHHSRARSRARARARVRVRAHSQPCSSASRKNDPVLKTSTHRFNSPKFANSAINTRGLNSLFALA
ncbi:hypothetical protein BC938DRAFT_472035, partial [Jimgerdemannia flammicorona]